MCFFCPKTPSIARAITRTEEAINETERGIRYAGD